MIDPNAILRQGQWFAALPSELQGHLTRLGRVQRLEAGQRLFRRGDPPDGLYAVLCGAVRIGTVSEQGKEALLTLVQAPQWFGEIALFDGQPRTHDACAESHCSVLHLPQAALLELLGAQPVYWRDIALLMTHKVRLAFIALEEMNLLPAPQRLARRLLLIAEQYGGARGAQPVIQLAQERLAAMLGISRQTANQALKELQADGVLRLTYAEIEILDLERLRAAARQL